MYRKITKTGPATLTIAIPATWVKSKKLKAGQYVEIIESENILTISPAKEKQTENIRIEYNETLIENMLEKLFLESTPIITIHSEDEIPKTINEIVNKFPGLQIVEQEPCKVVINQTLKPHLENPKALLRRSYIIMKEALTQNPPSFPKDFNDMIFLMQINQNYQKETLLLKELYQTISSIKKPMYDDAYALLRIIFLSIYNQKYSYSSAETKKIIETNTKTDKLFREYHQKSNSHLELSKLYHCTQLLNQLHNEIINEQSTTLLTNTQGKSSKKKFTVGVCLKNQSNTFWSREVKESMQNSALEYKNTEYLFDAPLTDFDATSQEQIVQKFLRAGVDGIIIAPVKTKIMTTTLSKINKINTPLLILDTDIETDDKYTFIGFDNYKGGYLTGKFIKSNLKKKSSILIIEGYAEGNFAKRVTGCVDALGKDFNITIVQGNFQESIAYDRTIQQLKKKNIDAIFATSDNMAMGAIKAVKSLRKNVQIYGFDMTEEGSNALKNKDLMSVVNTKPREMGILAVQTMNNLLNKKTVADKIEYQIELVTQKK
ncbi:MAG: substrate-binding domain-containing protein [Candidatus Woesearchaeota archaeon]